MEKTLNMGKYHELHKHFKFKENTLMTNKSINKKILDKISFKSLKEI